MCDEHFLFLEHIEAKASDKPIDITAQVNNLGDPPDLDLPLEDYFSGLRYIQTRLNYTDEPQSDQVLKRNAKIQMLKLKHIQKAVREWTDEKDKDNKKSFNAFRNFMLKEQALGSIGIANSVEDVQQRMQQIDTDITFIKEALTTTINSVSKLQQANNARHSSNTPSEEADKTEEMTRKILAAITNVQIESKNSTDELKIKELTKQLNQLKNRNNNGGGGGSSRNKKQFWER